MNAFIREFKTLFLGEPKRAERLSKVEVFSRWFWKVERIREVAIKERDLNTKIRCELISGKLRTRLNQLYDTNHLNTWKIN